LAARPLALAKSRIIEEMNLKGRGFALATIHRAENTDDKVRLTKVLSWLKEQARRTMVVLPLHPRTRRVLLDSGESFENILVVEPVGYLDMQRLLIGCSEVYTDSGGLQKEAYFHRKPCVTLRDETEWVETISCGWNRLWLNADYKPRKEIDEYGDGQAADRIAEILASSKH
jgi:UDP-GlcNAc3NAcA epimerase